MAKTENSDFLCPIKFSCGKLALDTLPGELRVYNAKKPLILFSSRAVANGLVDVVKRAFDNSEMMVGIYDGVPDSPSFDTVTALSKCYRQNGHDAFIAVGSGSVMNYAKLVNITVAGDVGDLSSCAGEDQIKGPLKPFFAVPDGSATGFLANGFAAVDRFTYVSRYLVPDYVVIDARTIGPEPGTITADAALRALTQSLCAYAFPETDYFISPYAYTGIQMIAENLVSVIANGTAEKTLKDYFVMSDSEKGRLGLAAASVIGGFIASRTPKDIVTRLSEVLTSYCGLNSGILAGILLPYGMDYLMTEKGWPVEKLLLPLAGFSVYAKTPETGHAQSVLDILVRMHQELSGPTRGGIPGAFSDVGISQALFSEIAEKAAQEDTAFDKQDFFAVLTAANEGITASLLQSN